MENKGYEALKRKIILEDKVTTRKKNNKIIGFAWCMMLASVVGQMFFATTMWIKGEPFDSTLNLIALISCILVVPMFFVAFTFWFSKIPIQITEVE